MHLSLESVEAVEHFRALPFQFSDFVNQLVNLFVSFVEQLLQLVHLLLAGHRAALGSRLQRLDLLLLRLDLQLHRLVFLLEDRELRLQSL